MIVPCRSRSPIHVNLAIALRTADIEDHHSLNFGHIDKLKTVGGSDLSWARRWFAACVWCVPFVVRLTLLIQTSCPRLERHVREFQICRQPSGTGGNDAVWVRGQLPAALPYPMTLLTGNGPKIYLTVRPAWGRPGGLSLSCVLAPGCGSQK